MENLIKYINEKLKLDKTVFIRKETPQSLSELKKLVNKEISTNGQECDLNFIDTSNITDMHALFDGYPYFNGDISDWDVSNVTNMNNMFNGCENFNCDISKWDVSKVEDMVYMFCYCKSFKQDLNEWKPISLKHYTNMFLYCKAKKPDWYNKLKN